MQRAMHATVQVRRDCASTEHAQGVCCGCCSEQAQSIDEEMQNDAVQILCNIAGSLPGDAVWACAALEAEVCLQPCVLAAHGCQVLKHSSDCTTASAVHLGPVVSALCVVATRHEALFARWGAQVDRVPPRV